MARLGGFVEEETRCDCCYSGVLETSSVLGCVAVLVDKMFQVDFESFDPLHQMYYLFSASAAFDCCFDWNLCFLGLRVDLELDPWSWDGLFVVLF